MLSFSDRVGSGMAALRAPLVPETTGRRYVTYENWAGKKCLRSVTGCVRTDTDFRRAGMSNRRAELGLFLVACRANRSRAGPE